MTLTPLQLIATIERKAASLPRFVIVPAVVLQPWSLGGTTVVDVTLNGTPIGRRSLKCWDDSRWFIELPQAVCTLTGVDTGVSAHFQLQIAADDLPSEITHVLQTNTAAHAAWVARTPSQQRMLREQVLAAKTSSTQVRRFLRGLGLPEPG